MKPHGALQTIAAERDEAVADAIVRAVRDVDPAVPVIAIAGSTIERAASAVGHPYVVEGFPDRAYAPDGLLLSRSLPGAVIHDPTEAAGRAVRMAVNGTVVAVDGTIVPLAPRTLCIHGDNPRALATARAVRAALLDAGVEIRAF